jgi:hypothetical protein
MPTRTNSTTVKPAMVKPAGAATGKRFELPLLDFKFGSLTEGTDIPPPPPSPIREERLKTPKEEGEKAKSAANGKANGTSDTSPQSNTSKSTGGTKRPANDNPASPTLSARQGSIRRLFSKNLLNNAYQEGENPSDVQRPESRTSTVTETKKVKRSSGWFSRLRTSESAGNKRASVVASPATPEKKRPAGPPPPMIPELSELKNYSAQEGGLSGDLFKDIK